MMRAVGVLVFGLTAATAMVAPGKGRGRGSGTARVVLCYEGKTVTAAGSAVKGLQKHGDSLGACVTTPATAMETTVAPCA